MTGVAADLDDDVGEGHTVEGDGLTGDSGRGGAINLEKQTQSPQDSHAATNEYS